MEEKVNKTGVKVFLDGEPIFIADCSSTTEFSGEREYQGVIKAGDGANDEFMKFMMNPNNSIWLDIETGNKYHGVTGEYIGNIKDDE